MTTSGSRDFNIDVAEIIEEAYERCGLEMRTGYDAKTARRSLNLMFAEWANRGLNLWTVEQEVLTLTQGQAQETLSEDVVDILEMALRRDGTSAIPFRFYPCMVAGLAYYLAMKRAPDRLQLLKAVYEEEFQRASEEDEDRVPLKLVPGRR
jgi:hypothetical protein